MGRWTHIPLKEPQQGLRHLPPQARAADGQPQTAAAASERALA
jgi:hypothetical protein